MSRIPQGYDKQLHKEVDGEIELKYVDLFDFLPKENIDVFKKELQRFVLSNEIPMYGSYRTKEDINRVDNMGQYFEGFAFSNLYDVKLSNNEYLKKYAPLMTISIYNLSATFLAVRYNVSVSKVFNEELANILKNEYTTITDICRRCDIPWYKPWKFGKTFSDCNKERKKEIHSKISRLKWEIYREIQRYIQLNFAYNNVFLPSFLTYHTNILPNTDRNHMIFWYSMGLDTSPDYSMKYDACISWDSRINGNVQEDFSAYCGGIYQNGVTLPEIAEYCLSEQYGVYMVAQSIVNMVERDIVAYNKSISEAIRSTKTTKLLKVRTMIERELYYSKRFLSEFDGSSIDRSSICAFYKLDGTKTLLEMNLTNIGQRVARCKDKVDRLIKLLDVSAEYEISKTNQSLQRWALIIAIVSMIIAFLSLLIPICQEECLYLSNV